MAHHQKNKNTSMANQLTLKLLIDNNSKKVLFAEASKDVVDFLFSLLAMPVGTITKLLTKERMVGCIGNLYKSVESLDENYFQSNSNQDKALLLDPKFSSSVLPNNTLFLTAKPSTNSASPVYYGCSTSTHNNGFGGYGVSCNNKNYTDVCNTVCPNCSQKMCTAMSYVKGGNSAPAAAAGANGFVKGMVTYTIMDDLTVTPMSTISSITLLNKFKVRDVSSLEECTVKLGMEEGLELLKASLQSKTVLTDVFLNKNRAMKT